MKKTQKKSEKLKDAGIKSTKKNDAQQSTNAVLEILECAVMTTQWAISQSQEAHDAAKEALKEYKRSLK